MLRDTSAALPSALAVPEIPIRPPCSTGSSASRRSGALPEVSTSLTPSLPPLTATAMPVAASSRDASRPVSRNSPRRNFQAAAACVTGKGVTGSGAEARRISRRLPSRSRCSAVCKPSITRLSAPRRSAASSTSAPRSAIRAMVPRVVRSAPVVSATSPASKAAPESVIKGEASPASAPERSAKPACRRRSERPSGALRVWSIRSMPRSVIVSDATSTSHGEGEPGAGAGAAGAVGAGGIRVSQSSTLAASMLAENTPPVTPTRPRRKRLPARSKLPSSTVNTPRESRSRAAPGWRRRRSRRSRRMSRVDSANSPPGIPS